MGAANAEMYDKTVVTPRLTAWYGDTASYKPDNNTSQTNTWIPELYALKEKIEKEFGYQFNGVLLNLYRDNNDSVAWHRVKESRYKKRPSLRPLALDKPETLISEKRTIIKANTVCRYHTDHYSL